MPTFPKVTNSVSFLAWDQYGESRAGEGGPIMPAQVASEHRIHFILPARAASYMIKWLTEQNIYWPIKYYSISRSQVSTCCLFSKLNHWATTFSTWWSVDGLINHSFFSFSPLMTVHQFPSRNIEKTYILQLISSLYFIFCLHLFSPPWGEKMNR